MLEHHDTKVPTNMENSSTDKVDYEKAVSLHEDASQEVFDEGANKRLLRKMDVKLLPFLALLYLLSFLDRTNIGNAKLAGLEESLGMTGKWDYNVSTAFTNLSGQDTPKMHVYVCISRTNMLPIDRCRSLLPLLCRCRDPLQHGHEALPPLHLDSFHHGRLGHLHYPHGYHPQLRRVPRHSYGSRSR
jgi:hypothetical protein